MRANFRFLKFRKPHFYRFSKGRAPENDEHRLNTISGIMDMRSISIKIHEMDIW